MNGVGLPEGWVKSELNAILLSIVGGGTPSKTNLEYYQGSIPWMSVKDMNKNTLRDTADHITQDAVDNSSTNIISAGTPIIATRMSLGKIVIATFDSAINQDLKALFLSKNIGRNFFVHWYRSQAQLIESLGTGTTVKGIRLEVLNALTIYIPPLAEQKIIAEKLDTLLARVDNTKTRLEQIPKILKRFRQAILFAATKGNLTKEDDNGNPLVSLNSVAANIVDCPHSTPKWRSSGKYCVRTTAFNPFKLDLTSQGFVDENTYQQRIQRLKPKPGDILYSREGTIGIACQIPNGVELCLGQRMVLIRPGEKIIGEFLTIVLNSPQILSIVREKTMGSMAPRINMSDIRKYELPLPILPKQLEIVRRVEQLFALADTIEKQVNAALDRVNHLTQSILAKAFRGDLTAQWRAENPDLISGENSAAALLEKIKAERAAAGGNKTSRKKA